MISESSRGWPRGEAFGLTSQVRRAAGSVVATIAEEQGRRGAPEFVHHLSIADGSFSEVEALVLVSSRFLSIDNPTEDRLLQQVSAVWRPLRGLMISLR